VAESKIEPVWCWNNEQRRYKLCLTSVEMWTPRNKQFFPNMSLRFYVYHLTEYSVIADAEIAIVDL
jgi:hypothetical protein